MNVLMGHLIKPANLLGILLIGYQLLDEAMCFGFNINVRSLTTFAYRISTFSQ